MKKNMATKWDIAVIYTDLKLHMHIHSLDICIILYNLNIDKTGTAVNKVKSL